MRAANLTPSGMGIQVFSISRTALVAGRWSGPAESAAPRAGAAGSIPDPIAAADFQGLFVIVRHGISPLIESPHDRHGCGAAGARHSALGGAPFGAPQCRCKRLHLAALE